jgi:hypothetical protein
VIAPDQGVIGPPAAAADAGSAAVRTVH